MAAQVVSIQQTPNLTVLAGCKRPHDGLAREGLSRFTLIEVHLGQPQHVALKWDNRSLSDWLEAKPESEKDLMTFRRTVTGEMADSDEFKALRSAYLDVLSFYVRGINHHFNVASPLREMACLHDPDEGENLMGSLEDSDLSALYAWDCNLSRIHIHWRPKFNEYHLPSCWDYRFKLDGTQAFSDIEQTFTGSGPYVASDYDLHPLFDAALDYYQFVQSLRDSKQMKLFDRLAQTKKNSGQAELVDFDSKKNPVKPNGARD